ncbi:uncharacterized protein [Coffea arabica]|uniref:Uncharacterized protein isoform X2 n=1 Tax=Coffea arabica TaxID=13443 RepID=A0ABM4VUX1_COFAR
MEDRSHRLLRLESLGSGQWQAMWEMGTCCSRKMCMLPQLHYCLWVTLNYKRCKRRMLFHLFGGTVEYLHGLQIQGIFFMESSEGGDDNVLDGLASQKRLSL